MTMNGDYSNRSKYIRVDCKPEGSFPITAGPFGHAKYYNPIYVGSNGSENDVPVIFRRFKR